jgi:ATP-dependent helicase/nuclease subunit B
MTLTGVRVRPGAASSAWLAERISEIKGTDPLAPVSVVVASNHVGLAARRALARSGYANVRFGVMGRLVEPLGGARLAAAGKTPLTVPAAEAAIRQAISRKGSGFGDVGAHPALVRALGELFGEIRGAEVDGARLDELKHWGLMAAAAVDVYREYRTVLADADLYDDHDLLAAATESLAGADAVRTIRETGAVLVYLPTALTPAEARFVATLARSCRVEVALDYLGDSLADGLQSSIAATLGLDWATLPLQADKGLEAQLLTAPDATEEVRSVVRVLLSRLSGGLELGRVAIVYRERDPYGPLIRDTLNAADVPWAGLDGRSLAESWPGRGLLGLLRLREREFARVDVLGWLGALPETDPGGVSIGDWDRLSRVAAVVAGAEQWQERLRLRAAEVEAEADERRRSGGSEGAIRYLRRQANALRRMADFIQAAEADTRAPADRTWSGFAVWAERVRRKYLPVRDTWPERESEADEIIGELLIQMASAGEVEAEVELGRFVEACEADLESRRQAEGRIGSGVAVGPIGALRGMDFDLVFVVGATERAFPRPSAPDPFFPPDAGRDPLGTTERQRAEERRDFLAAVGSAKEVWLSFPAYDPDLRPSYPSPWILKFAQPQGGHAASASAVRAGTGANNLTAIASPDGGLAKASSPLNVAEWRVLMARSQGAGLANSGLAARLDLPLQRHLEARAARRSNAFTEFDGNVASEVSRLEVLRLGLAGRRHSASTIEMWAACPFSYLLDRVLGVEPTERPEQDIAWAIGAAAKGSLVHAILSRFFKEMAEGKRPRPYEIYADADRQRIENIAREEFRKLEEAGAIGNRLAWENERRGILLDLQTFLRKDEELRSDGLVPTYFEQAFGIGDGSWPELTLDLGSGASARVVGRIDRIDLGPDPAGPVAARLIDYKTGRAYSQKDFEADPVVAGTRVQPSIYASALRARFPGLRVDSGYWFVSAKGEFEFVSVPGDGGRLGEVLRVVDEGLHAGAFPQVPGSEDRASWKNCTYCPFDRICPQGRDELHDRKQDQPGALIHLQLGTANGD